MPRVDVLDHPLAGELLATLRDERTLPADFRDAAYRLGLLLVAEASRSLPTREETVRTPVGTAAVRRPAAPPVILPVLRAGLGLLDAATDLFPDAPVGFLGLERDEETHVAREYYRRIPVASGHVGLVLEPMLATGGSASAAVGSLRDAGADEVVLVSVVAAPPGIERLERDHPGVRIVTAAVDEGLDANAFIVPGLGDFGDRLFRTEG